MNMSNNVHIQNFLKHFFKEDGAGIVLIPLKNKWDIINVTLIRQNAEQTILLTQLTNNLKQERYFQLPWASAKKSRYPGRKIEPGNQTLLS